MTEKKENIQDVVTPEWLAKEMKKKRVTLSEIADFYGIHYMSLHQYASGKLKMTKTVKPLFWMYLNYVV